MRVAYGNMPVAKIRKILDITRKLAPFLTEQEASDIAKVYDRACDRLLAESQEEGRRDA